MDDVSHSSAQLLKRRAAAIARKKPAVSRPLIISFYLPAELLPIAHSPTALTAKFSIAMLAA
ncbi:MAG: hypothetical protein ACXVD9_11465, partial [Actinomycetota bacterium]